MEGKITKPELPPHFVKRERLAKKINTAKKFAYIMGEAGAGKTMLASSASPKNSVWISLDEDDTNFTNFISTLFLSLKRNLSVSSVLGKEITDQNIFSVALNTVLKIIEEKEANITIVLDNLNTIADGSDTEKFISRLFKYAPPNAKFIFTSRSEPPAFIIRNIDKGHIIEKESLAFNTKETEELLKKLEVKTDFANDIYNLTKGWAMGTFLAAYSIKSSGTIKKDYTFRFLMEEVFEKLGKKERDFLIKTSLFDTMAPREVEEFLKIQNADKVLKNLMKKGLFITKTQNLYSYHDIFRDFLREEARKTLNFKEMQNALAAYYAKNKKIKNAIKHFLLAENRKEIVKILKTANPYELTPYAELAIKAIQYVNSKDAHIMQLLGALHFLSGNREKAYEIYEANKNKWKKQKFNELYLLKWQFMSESGDYGEVINEYEKFKDKVEKLPLSKRAKFLYYVAESYYYKGESEKAEKIIKRVYKNVERHGKDILLFTKTANAYCVINFHNKGLLREAENIYKMIITRAEENNTAVMPLVLANLALAETLLGNIKEAKIHGEMAIKMAEESGITRDLKFARLSYAYYLTAVRNYKKAIEIFTKHLDSENPYIKSSAYYGLSNVYRKLKETEKAEYLAKTDLSITEKIGSSMMIAQSLINIGVVLITKKSFQKAKNILKKAYEKAKESKNIYEIARAALFYAVSLIENKDKGFEPYLEEAKSIIEKEKFYFLVKSESEIIYTALKKAKKKELIHMTESYFGLPTLKIETLGEFKIMLNGVEISKSLFKRRKEKQLFEFIVSKLPSFATMDEILDVFFNSSNTKSARHNALSLLSMTRRALENMELNNLIVRTEEGYKINTELSDIDFLQFEKLLNEGKSEKNIEKLKHAVNLYKGDFLSDLPYEDWPIAKRELLIGKYISALFYIAEKTENNEKIEYLNKILKKDPVNDEAVYKLMEAHIEMGNKGKAAEIFKSYEKLLMDEYELTPSKKLRLLFEKIS